MWRRLNHIVSLRAVPFYVDDWITKVLIDQGIYSWFILDDFCYVVTVNSLKTISTSLVSQQFPQIDIGI